MNYFYHNGLIFETERKYLRIDVADSFHEENDINLDLLYITLDKSRKSSDYPQYQLVKDVLQDVPLRPTDIEIPWYDLDGLRIRPRVHNLRFCQTLVDRVNLFTHYDERSVTIFISPSTDKNDYIDQLSQVPLLEVDPNSVFEYKNYNNIVLGKSLQITSTSDKSITPKSYFTKYIFNEPHMVYQLNQHILKQLSMYNIDNMEKQGDPDHDLKSSNVLTYRIGNESMEKMHVFPTGYLRRAIAVSVPMEYQIKVQSLSIAMDIRNKFMNYDLISDITSIEMIDANGNPFRVQIWWDPQMSDLGDKESTVDEMGMYNHLLTIRCTVNYYIFRDEEELVRITRVKGLFNLLDKLNKVGAQLGYDSKDGTVQRIRPLAEWEVEKILNGDK